MEEFSFTFYIGDVFGIEETYSIRLVFHLFSIEINKHHYCGEEMFDVYREG